MKKKSKFETGIPAFANTLLKKQEFDFIVFLFHGKILDRNCGSCTQSITISGRLVRMRTYSIRSKFEEKDIRCKIVLNFLELI